MKNRVWYWIRAGKQRRPTQGLWWGELLEAIVDCACLAILLDFGLRHWERLQSWNIVVSIPCMTERPKAHRVWIFGLRNRARRESGWLAMSELLYLRARKCKCECAALGMRARLENVSWCHVAWASDQKNHPSFDSSIISGW